MKLCHRELSYLINHSVGSCRRSLAVFFSAQSTYFVSALFLSCLCMSVLVAQSERGSISGSVKDSSGAVIGGAAILVTNSATNLQEAMTSNQDGEFTIQNLPPGEYSLRVEKQGFNVAVVNGVPLNAAANLREDVVLQVGTTRQVLEVQSVAIQTQTEDAKTSATVTNKMVDELPLVVGGALRSPFDLAAITPEAKNLGGDNGFVLGGGQAAAYTVTLDGVSANTTRPLQKSWVSVNAPSLEAITEFTVDTNGFKAEYGHSNGGIMTFVSKSGENTFHGSAYEFLRNNDFDANYFFSNARGIARPIYKQNDFGASFGGPVWIPKLYNGHNKTFFFFSYEGFRNRAGANASTTTVPTPEMYNGDFSKWVNAAGALIPIYNPKSQVTNANGTVTRAVFPNNQIPASLFDPLAQKALSVFQTSGVLKPNNGAAPGTAAYVTNNYIISRGSLINPANKWSIKGDHYFSEKDHVSGYYGHNTNSTIGGADGAPTLPGLYTTQDNTYQASDVVRFSWDHIFSASKLNHFYAGGNNWSTNSLAPQQSQGPWQSKFCLPNVPSCDTNLVNLAFSNGYSSWGAAATNGAGSVIYAFNDDFSWIHGPHSFKFGGMFQRSEYNGYGNETIAGQAGFSFLETGVPGNTNFATAGGNPFASFLLGWADNGQIATPRYIGQNWPYVAGYFQDDWHVSSKLVFNLGLRWENQFPPYEPNGNFSDFSPTTPNPAAGGIPGAVIFAGSGAGRQGSNSLAGTYYGAWGPRFAFAYAPNSKTSIRGGYSRSFAQIQTSAGSTHLMGLTLIQNFTNGTNGIQPSFLFSQGVPPWTPPPFINPSVSNGNTVSWWQGSEATRPPEDNNFTLSIQRQLSQSMLLDVAYNGVIGSHLQSGIVNYNQVNPANLAKYGASVLTANINSQAAIAAGITAPFPGFAQLWGNQATVAQALRPFPQYSTIDTEAGGGDHSGHSTYHAAIVKLDKRFSKGLTFQTSYAFSKLLTDSDTYWVNNPPSYAADQYNRRLEKSIGQYDVTHNFKFAGIYDLPFGRGQRWLNHGFASAILGNWRISSINIYQSGQPVAITTTVTPPLFAGRTAPYITSYTGWQPSWSGSFDPAVNHFFVPYGTGPFPLQGPGTALNGIGNATRYNPKVRQFPGFNENMSLAKEIPIKERLRLDFRAEAFNVFNRVRFGTGSTSIQAQNFGVLTSNADILNTPRQLQLALKLSF